MRAEYCCFSGDLIITLQGQTTNLPTYALQDDDNAVRDAGAFGPCYLSELAASPWGALWAERLTRHWTTIGGRLPSQDGAWKGLLFPNTPELELIHDRGTLFVVRLDQPRQETSSGVLIQQRAHEHTLRLGEGNQAILDEVRRKVRDQGAFPLLEFLDALRLTHRLRDTASLEKGALLFDEELYEYWADTAITVMVTHSVLIPTEAVDLLRGADVALTTR